MTTSKVDINLLTDQLYAQKRAHADELGVKSWDELGERKKAVEQAVRILAAKESRDAEIVKLTDESVRQIRATKLPTPIEGTPKIVIDSLGRPAIVFPPPTLVEGKEQSESDTANMKKYGTIDPETIRELEEVTAGRTKAAVVDFPRLPRGKVVILTKEVVKPEYQPQNFQDEESVNIPGEITPEDRDLAIKQRQAELREHQRSVDLLEGARSYFNLGLVPSTMTTSFPTPTLAESRSKALKMPIEILKEAAAGIPAQIAAYNSAEVDRRALAMKNQRSHYGYPENPRQAAEITADVDLLMQAYSEVGTFDKMAKAIPHLKELQVMYQEVLDAKLREQADQKAKAGYVLKNVAEIAKDAEKILPKIVKLSAEYTSHGRDDVLSRLAVLVEQYQVLQSKFYGETAHLRLLDVKPNYPPMHDLPVMPNRLWKKIEEIARESK